MHKLLFIRQYQPGDKEAVWQLHIDALKPTGALLPGGKWHDDDLHDVLKHYLNNNGDFLVGLIGNKIVCMGALRKKSETVGEIKRMRVHPDYQRRGYGQLILDKLEAKAKKLGYTGLFLDTTTRQTAAQKFYGKNGYHQVGSTSYSGLDILFYEKTLR